MNYEKLRKIRKEKGFSMKYMAERIGKTTATYQKKEKGEIPFFADEIMTVSKILDTNINIFLS